MNKRHYEHTLPNIRGSLSNTYLLLIHTICKQFVLVAAILYQENI